MPLKKTAAHGGVLRTDRRGFTPHARNKGLKGRTQFDLFAHCNLKLRVHLPNTDLAFAIFVVQIFPVARFLLW